MCFILSVIPARGGSKQIPYKNIRILNGKPLIYYPIFLAKTAQEKGIISDHLVSTDSQEIADIALNAGAYVPFLRPDELATDESPVVDTLLHAVEYYETIHNVKVNVVCLLQPTNPLTIMSDLEGAISLYLKQKPPCLISVCDAQHIRLSTLYYKRKNFLIQILDCNAIEPRQSIDPLVWRNGAIYLIRRDLLTQKKAITKNPVFYEMPRERSVPIDDLYDWKLAELYLKARELK